MPKTDMIRARVEPELKRGVEAVFSALGLSTTEAITLFHKQVIIHHGIPFDVRLPNRETLEAIAHSRKREGLTEYASFDEIIADCGY